MELFEKKAFIVQDYKTGYLLILHLSLWKEYYLQYILYFHAYLWMHKYQKLKSF